MNNEMESVNNIIESNDTLLISEILNKVVLPYTGDEIQEILENENNNYKTAQEVVDGLFTKKLSDYKLQFFSRYSETMRLIKETGACGVAEAISLSIEVMRKKYLYPAIITACRTLDELNVYLDCLEKNELDEFKIFEIKYELYPVVIKEEKGLFVKTNGIQRIVNFFKSIFGGRKPKHAE